MDLIPSKAGRRPFLIPLDQYSLRFLLLDFLKDLTISLLCLIRLDLPGAFLCLLGLSISRFKFPQLLVAIPEQVDSVIGLESIALNWAEKE